MNNIEMRGCLPRRRISDIINELKISEKQQRGEPLSDAELMQSIITSYLREVKPVIRKLEEQRDLSRLKDVMLR